MRFAGTPRLADGELLGAPASSIRRDVGQLGVEVVEVDDPTGRGQVLRGAARSELGHPQRQEALAQAVGVDPVVHAGVVRADHVGVGAVRVRRRLRLVQAAGAAEDVERRAPDVAERHGEVLGAAVADVDDERLAGFEVEAAGDVDLADHRAVLVGGPRQGEVVGAATWTSRRRACR